MEIKHEEGDQTMRDVDPIVCIIFMLISIGFIIAACLTW